MFTKDAVLYIERKISQTNRCRNVAACTDTAYVLRHNGNLPARARPVQIWHNTRAQHKTLISPKCCNIWKGCDSTRGHILTLSGDTSARTNKNIDMDSDHRHLPRPFHSATCRTTVSLSGALTHSIRRMCRFVDIGDEKVLRKRSPKDSTKGDPSILRSRPSTGIPLPSDISPARSSAASTVDIRIVPRHTREEVAKG